MGTNDVTPTQQQVQDAMNAHELPQDLYNMAAALKWCLMTISREYPDCKIFVMTPIQRSFVKYGLTGTDSVEDMRERCEFVIKLVEDYSAYLIDMYHQCGIIGCNEPIANGIYLADGLHPNSNGAEKMKEYVDCIIQCFL